MGDQCPCTFALKFGIVISGYRCESVGTLRFYLDTEVACMGLKPWMPKMYVRPYSEPWAFGSSGQSQGMNHSMLTAREWWRFKYFLAGFASVHGSDTLQSDVGVRMPELGDISHVDAQV